MDIDKQTRLIKLLQLQNQGKMELVPVFPKIPIDQEKEMFDMNENIKQAQDVQDKFRRNIPSLSDEDKKESFNRLRSILK